MNMKFIEDMAKREEVSEAEEWRQHSTLGHACSDWGGDCFYMTSQFLKEQGCIIRNLEVCDLLKTNIKAKCVQMSMGSSLTFKHPVLLICAPSKPYIVLLNTKIL